VAGSQTVVGY